MKIIFTNILILCLGMVSGLNAQVLFIFESATVATGDEICIPVKVEGFSNVLTMQFEVHWDTSVVEFVRADNEGLPNLFSQSLINSQTQNTVNGEVRVSWFDDITFAGIDLDDGTVIFDLCFKVKGAPGSLGIIEIKEQPDFPVEVRDPEDNVIDYDQTEGEINVIQPTASEDDFLHYSDPVELTSGMQSFCMPVKVRNFKSIAGIDYSVRWDANRFRFDAFNVIANLPGSASLSVNSAPDVVQQGIVYLNFVELSGVGASIPDESVLFELCLTYLEDERCVLDSIYMGSSFGSEEINVFILDEDGIDFLEIPLFQEMGPITRGTPLQLIGADVQGTDCIDPDKGSIALNITGGESGLMYRWGDGPSTFGRTNLTAGTYTVTVDDNCEATEPLELSFEVQGDTLPPSAEAGSTITLDCINPIGILDGTGSATENVNYMWTTSDGNITNGINTLAPQVDKEGTYFINVTSTANGCTNQDSVVVTSSQDIPVSNAGPDKGINCTNQSVSLDGTSSSMGSNYSYSWTTVNGVITSGQNQITATAMAPGTYTLEVRDINNQCVSRDEVNVTGDIELPNVVIADPGMLSCNMSSISLDGSNSETGVNINYNWSASDGGVISSGSDINSTTIDVTATGTYTLEVVNTVSNCRNQVMVMVEMNTGLSNFSAGPDLILDCEGEVTNLEGMISDPVNTTYSWTAENGGNIVSGESTLNPIVDQAGRYIISATNSVSGCSDVDTVEVSIELNLPIANAGVDTEIGCGSSFILDGSQSASGFEYLYQWNVIAGEITDGETTLSPTISQAGSYEIVVTDVFSTCTNRDTVVITNTGELPDANAGEDFTLDCEGATADIDATMSALGDDISYEWIASNGGNIVDGVHTVLPTISGAGTYEIIVIDSNTQCSNKDTVVVTVSENLPLTDAGADQKIGCNGEEVVLQGENSASGGNFIYEWTTDIGTIVSGESTLNPTVNDFGQYILKVTEIISGCNNTDTIEVGMQGDFPLSDAGEDFTNCSEDGVITANITNGITGGWSSVDGAEIADINSSSTTVMGLQVGINKFVWSLSTASCPDYSRDTIVVTVPEAPIASDDNMELNISQTNATISVLDNDSYSSIDDIFYQITSQPTRGELSDEGGGIFSFVVPTVAGTYLGSYELCDATCMDLCSTANISFVVKEAEIPTTPISIDEKLLSIGITPNGDGKNETLVFDALLENPGGFPESRLFVFNRWGEVVFERPNYDNDWGGTNMKNQLLPQGTYYFVLKLDIGNGDIIKGDVTILR